MKNPLRFIIVPKVAHPWYDDVHRGARAQAALLSKQLGVEVTVEYMPPPRADVTAHTLLDEHVFGHTSNYCSHTQVRSPAAAELGAIGWGGRLAGGGEEPKLPITILYSHTIGAALPVAVWRGRKPGNLTSLAAPRCSHVGAPPGDALA
jgi:hypothetical protein